MTWFSGGTLNASVNCLDRHVEAGGGDKVAYHWEGEPGEERAITYAELLEEVCRFANALRSLGVQRGDRVAIYLGMIPELPVAMLACARIGAPHSVVFGGFSADSLRDRINDAEAKVLVTADGGYRRGQVVPLKANADEAVAECPSIEHVVTVRRTGGEHPFTPGRDLWYQELIAAQSPECEPEQMDAEDLLYLLYTSGTTGKPKGIVHTTGGYLTQITASHQMIFDIHEDDMYWCAADIGWVTGHSYIVYGPLANHTTGIIYEGAPDWPDKDRLWQIVEKRKATILYTAPTAIRAFMPWGTEFPQGHDLSSLRLLGTVGEPINPERLSTYEIESAFVDNSKVAEAAVVSRPDDLVGEAIVAFVTLKSGFEGTDEVAKELREHVSNKIGKIARPNGIIFTADLPKTRSGKIMRRLLRDVARSAT